MTSRQIAAALLVMVLSFLLGWTFIQGMGDFKLQLLLGLGIMLGTIYAVYGELPA